MSAQELNWYEKAEIARQAREFALALRKGKPTSFRPALKILSSSTKI